jgi:integrase
MATLFQLPSGRWRAQIRRKGRYISETFIRHQDADVWAKENEVRIDQGRMPKARGLTDPRTFGDLIDLHLKDLEDVGKTARRSKAFSLDQLKRKIGDIGLRDLDRHRLIKFGRERAKEGAGKATLSIDFTFIKTIMVHAAAVHGIEVITEEVFLARTALKLLGLIGKGKERDRRPTDDELERILKHLDRNNRLTMPVGRMVQFAIATAMRQEEICSITWKDVDVRKRIVIVRNRKDPREKTGNDQKVPLIDATGIDAWQILQQQKFHSPNSERIFPYNGRSVGTAFRRACHDLEITDFHFHDLRHEATSRLFEAGLAIHEVALVTGHKDWKMLKRYANLRPENLVNRNLVLPRGVAS